MNLNELTKKNQEFIHIATNQLIADGKSDEEIKTILEKVIPQILEEQKHGRPARSFLGAPTKWAQEFTAQKEEQEATKTNDNPWLMFIDSSLFFLGFIAVFSGLMNTLDHRNTVYGLISLIVFGFAGGAMLYFMYRYQGRLQGNGQRFAWLKSILVLIPVMIVLILIVTLAGLLPATINVQLPGYVLIILGAIALGGRYLLKRHYNIQSSFTPRVNQ